MSHPPCRTCREQHKKCDGKRPCERCAKVGRACEEPVKKKRGRPRLEDVDAEHPEAAALVAQGMAALDVVMSEEDKKPVVSAEYNYEQHEGRLVAAHKLLLSVPEALFANPLLAAQAFGIALSRDFYVAELGPFTADMSLCDHLRASRLRYATPSLLRFLGRTAAEMPTLADIPWSAQCDAMVCTNLVREAVTAPLPNYGVRQWQHTKSVETRDGVYSVACKGYILANLRVMFVDAGAQTLVRSVVPEPLVWDDRDLFFDLSAGLNSGEDSDGVAMDMFDM